MLFLWKLIKKFQETWKKQNEYLLVFALVKVTEDGQLTVWKLAISIRLFLGTSTPPLSLQWNAIGRWGIKTSSSTVGSQTCDELATQLGHWREKVWWWEWLKIQQNISMSVRKWNFYNNKLGKIILWLDCSSYGLLCLHLWFVIFESMSSDWG